MTTGSIGSAAGGAPMAMGAMGAGKGLLSAVGSAHLHVKAVQPTPRVRSVDDLAILYMLLANQQSQSTSSNTIMSLAVKPANATSGTQVDLMV